MEKEKKGTRLCSLEVIIGLKATLKKEEHLRLKVRQGKMRSQDDKRIIEEDQDGGRVEEAASGHHVICACFSADKGSINLFNYQYGISYFSIIKKTYFAKFPNSLKKT